MTTEIKKTKKMVLTAITNYFAEQDATIEVDGIEITADDILEYANTAIEQLNAKATKAKEAAAKKKADGDELTKVIEEALTDEYQTVADIVDAIEGEDVTRGKVTARIAQLIKAGKAHKTFVKTEEGRKIVAYAAGPAPETEDAE
jgi:hypothetical protein